MSAALSARRCARCGSRIRGLHVFSRFTRKTYCSTDIAGCDARVARQKAKEAA